MQAEINLLTDWYTDELFDLAFTKLIAPFSRVFCDVERFANDSLEIMSKYGMGMCYTHLDNGELMREVTPELRAKIKSAYYDPHHQLLEDWTTDALNEFGKVLIIDCHSFTEIPFKRDLNQETPRPDFCIGTSEYHTPERLVAASVEFLSEKGYSTSINKPYSGSMIPMKFYQKEENVMGIMIEVNRKLYVNASNGKVKKNSNFDSVRRIASDLIYFLSSQVLSLPRLGKQ